MEKKIKLTITTVHEFADEKDYLRYVVALAGSGMGHPKGVIARLWEKRDAEWRTDHPKGIANSVTKYHFEEIGGAQ